MDNTSQTCLTSMRDEKEGKIMKVLQDMLRILDSSSQTINERVDAKAVRYKSPINRAIVIIVVVVMMNAKRQAKLLKGF